MTATRQFVLVKRRNEQEPFTKAFLRSRIETRFEGWQWCQPLNRAAWRLRGMVTLLGGAGRFTVVFSGMVPGLVAGTAPGPRLQPDPCRAEGRGGAARVSLVWAGRC